MAASSDPAGSTDYDLVVIGGGPAGYATALYGAAAGLAVAVVESDKIGGTCLHRGCIPAKELLQTASVMRAVSRAGEFGIGTEGATVDWRRSQQRKQRVVDELARGLASLLARRTVTVVAGLGSLVAPGIVAVARPGAPGRELRAPYVVLATGSMPSQLAAFEPDGEVVLDSDGVLSLESLPSSAVVIGGGAIGCEFASMLCDLGSRVALLEAAPALLPGADVDVSRALQRAFVRRGIDVRTGVVALGEERREGGTTVLLEDGGRLETSNVVVAIGRSPRSTGLLGAGTGVQIDDLGHVRVNEWMRTADDTVFAIGDLVGTPALAHVGFAEAMLVVRQILGEPATPIDYAKVPWCIYSEPEVAYVGLTEQEALRAGRDVLVMTDRFAGNGRARITGETEGFVKVIAEQDANGGTGSVLGVHMIGPWVTEQLGQAHLAVNWGASPAELAGLVQPHPSFSEAYGETLLALAGRGLHLD